MDFEIARQWMIPYGRHKDQTLDMVAQSDDGLKYLDWLVDQPYWWVTKDDLRTAIQVYLSDPQIAKELGDTLDEGGMSFEF